jgi:hypothetical protein
VAAQGRLMRELQNNALQLTAPLGAARHTIGGVASCSPFGEHRRRS